MRELDAQLASIHTQSFAPPGPVVTQSVSNPNAHENISAGLSADLLSSQTFDQNLASNDLQQPWDIGFAGMDDAFFNNHDQMLDLAEQFQTDDLDPSILFTAR